MVESPWPLHTDGDLGEMLLDIARSRGFASFSMQWTKGHVTLKFLASGGGQARDGIFNSLADRAASKGYDLQHSRCAHALLDYFAQKQKRSIHIFRAICKRIARVAQAATEKLELMKRSETLGRNSSYIDAPAAPMHDTQGRIQLAFEVLPHIDKDADDAQAEARIRIFWQRLYVIPLVDVTSEVGATWLELFILFHMRGAAQLRISQHQSDIFEIPMRRAFGNFSGAPKLCFTSHPPMRHPC